MRFKEGTLGRVLFLLILFKLVQQLGTVYLPVVLS